MELNIRNIKDLFGAKEKLKTLQGQRDRAAKCEVVYDSDQEEIKGRKKGFEVTVTVLAILACLWGMFYLLFRNEMFLFISGKWIYRSLQAGQTCLANRRKGLPIRRLIQQFSSVVLSNGKRNPSSLRILLFCLIKPKLAILQKKVSQLSRDTHIHTELPINYFSDSPNDLHKWQQFPKSVSSYVLLFRMRLLFNIYIKRYKFMSLTNCNRPQIIDFSRNIFQKSCAAGQHM